MQLSIATRLATRLLAEYRAEMIDERAEQIECRNLVCLCSIQQRPAQVRVDECIDDRPTDAGCLGHDPLDLIWPANMRHDHHRLVGVVELSQSCAYDLLAACTNPARNNVDWHVHSFVLQRLHRLVLPSDRDDRGQDEIGDDRQGTERRER